MDRQLDSLTLLGIGCFCVHPVIVVTIPAEMNTNKPCLKPPGRGYWPVSQGRVSLQLKKRFLRLIFVPVLRRDELAINTPGFQPLSFYGAVIERSL